MGLGNGGRNMDMRLRRRGKLHNIWNRFGWDRGDHEAMTQTVDT